MAVIDHSYNLAWTKKSQNTQYVAYFKVPD
jgi:hypothetical protein